MSHQDPFNNAFFNDFDKRQKVTKRRFVTVWLAMLAVNFVILGVVVWVAWHFISKVW